MDDTVRVLDHGFVRLDGALADDLSVANAARVSFARRKDELEDEDRGLIRFLMRERHGTPFEHNSFRFHIRCPIFVAREWMRHRVGCLPADTVVTVVNCEGSTSPRLRKTIGELHELWTRGEHNGKAPDTDAIEQIRVLASQGLSDRAIARETRLGRRVIRHIRRGVDVRYRDARWRVRRLRLRVLDESTGEFTTGHIADVIFKGEQPVYELTLADGKTIRMTENHRVLSTDGWQTMGDAVGLTGSGETARMSRECSLLVNGTAPYRSAEWLQLRRSEGCSVSEMADLAGCSYHTIRKWLKVHDLCFAPGETLRGRVPWNRGRRYATGHRISESHRAAIRSARSGPRSNFWRGGITPERADIAAWATRQAPRVHARYDYTCHSCDRRGGRLHAHHIVPVWLDASRARSAENLISVCESCHSRIHASVSTELAFLHEHRWRLDGPVELPEAPSRRGARLAAHAVPVTGVRYVGVLPTYDLTMEGSWHNFVANGVVVHNSFNEFSMRYAKATDDFYVPDAADVRTQVGKPGSYSFERVDDELAERTRAELQDVYEHAYATYEGLVEAGVARELARSVIPVGAYTEFYWTVNARSLMNFISLRNAENAQREIQRYAQACETFFEQRMPITYAAFVANERRAP